MPSLNNIHDWKSQKAMLGYCISFTNEYVTNYLNVFVAVNGINYINCQVSL